MLLLIGTILFLIIIIYVYTPWIQLEENEFKINNDMMDNDNKINKSESLDFKDDYTRLFQCTPTTPPSPDDMFI